MRVLAACEWSGAVRSAFDFLGWESFSCDLIDTELTIGGTHIKGDVKNILEDDWDLIVAFPPCTYLCSSGARWWESRRTEQQQAIKFVMDIWNCNCDRIAIENPIGILSTAWRKPDQIIQPWQFGHGEVKTTCLWLKNLPPLRPTSIVEKREQKCWRMSPSVDRSKERGRTYAGIAWAMATQWSRACV